MREETTSISEEKINIKDNKNSTLEHWKVVKKCSIFALIIITVIIIISAVLIAIVTSTVIELQSIIATALVLIIMIAVMAAVCAGYMLGNASNEIRELK